MCYEDEVILIQTMLRLLKEKEEKNVSAHFCLLLTDYFNLNTLARQDFDFTICSRILTLTAVAYTNFVDIHFCKLKYIQILLHFFFSKLKNQFF